MIVKYPKNFSNSRNSIILSYCKNKDVLHIWAANSPSTKEKYYWKIWPLLYRNIDKVCKSQLWIDIDQKCTDFLNSKDDFKNSKIKLFDMNKLNDLDYIPDVIVFGEVIEHLMNIEVALTNIKKVMNSKTILIISTPNAYCIDAFVDSMFWYEKFNDDHKVLFSYWYLKNLLSFNNLYVEKWFFTNLDSYKNKLNIFWKIRKVLSFPLKLCKFNKNTILVVSKLTYE